MQASKWISLQVLLDADEMRALFEHLNPFFLFQIGSIIERGKEIVAHEKFLNGYNYYIECLQQGKLPDEQRYRNYFSLAITNSGDVLTTIPYGEDKKIMRLQRPVIQQQVHRMDYSHHDHKFRSMVLGPETILWGIQYSYPQLFQDEKTHAVEQVKENERFPNTELFHRLQRWVRNFTSPTPFIVDGGVVNTPMRLGKQCFAWINRHPQLIQKNLQVKV